MATLSHAIFETPFPKVKRRNQVVDSQKVLEPFLAVVHSRESEIVRGALESVPPLG